MKSIKWANGLDLEVDGVNFRCTLNDYSEQTTNERFSLLKDRSSLEQYAAVFSEETPKNILEFGIFQGGSPALFSLLFDAEKFVGVDICQPVPAFDEFCRTHPAGRNIRSYYGTSQTDAQKIEQLVQKEFGLKPIDLIIDDASHHYAESRRTFEITFPLLRPGGTYVIEDWGWAHWSDFKMTEYYSGVTPLSMLIMELLMTCASRGDLISEVRVFPSFVFIRKSMHAPPLKQLSLDGLYEKRNIELMGIRHLNMKGAIRLAGTRLAQISRRRFKRTKEKLIRALGHKRLVA